MHAKQWTMPQDGAHDATQDAPPTRRDPAASGRRADWRDKFGMPVTVKRVFDKFPLVTYPANDLPSTSPAQRHVHTLWLWTTWEGAETGAPSFNPSCLKWQVRQSPRRPIACASANHETTHPRRPTSSSMALPLRLGLQVTMRPLREPCPS